MKTIVVPTDFSTHAANALHYAAFLAGTLNAKIILFHAFHVPVAYTEVPATFIAQTDVKAEIGVELKKKAEGVQKAIGKSLPIECICREGLLINTIKEFMAEEKVDLLVMGTQGASGLEEILIGSHSAYMVEKINCPVLVIPASVTFFRLQKIMYATDFQFNDFMHINQVGEIARLYDAEILITHVSTNPKKAAEEEQLMDWFMEIAQTNISYRKIAFRTFTGGNVLDKLNEAVKALGIDMLCMSTVRRTFFEKIYHGSLTKKMAYHTGIPLLAFHIHETNRL